MDFSEGKQVHVCIEIDIEAIRVNDQIDATLNGHKAQDIEVATGCTMDWW